MPARHAGAGAIFARRWMATAAATLCSTWMLDAVATATGLMLVASGLLAGAGQGPLLLLLGGSYLAWGLGLRSAVAANWALLTRTGASTCLFSKLAHDLARGLSAGPRLRRLAAGAGYVGTEAAKEAPYYAGAFGALLLLDAVSGAEAIVFLAGANLGAAAYETALARGTRTFLGRAGAAPPHADFRTDWSPAAYLSSYYAEVEADERQTVAFFVDAFRTVPAGASVLIFGAGPTLHHAFPATGRDRRVDIGDFLPANLDEVRRWLGGEPGAHDWTPFVRHTLACEGSPADRVVDAAAVARRERHTRERVASLVEVDLRRPDPVGRGARTWDVVISAYCADSATADLATWRLYMQRIAALVAPGGTLLVAALCHAPHYVVGAHRFPSADVGPGDMRAALAASLSDVVVETRAVPEQRRHGYDAIILARATRPRTTACPRPYIQCAYRKINV